MKEQILEDIKKRMKAELDQIPTSNGKGFNNGINKQYLEIYQKYKKEYEERIKKLEKE